MTGSIRLYVTEPLHDGESITATPAQAHYLGTVMRRAVGDPLRLFNGRDGEFAARIATLRRDHARLQVDHQLRPQLPEPDLWLAFALLKRDATDLVIQKATELGTAVLLPITTERSNTHRMNANRLTAIAVEAAEQCERLSVPELRSPQSLAALLAGWPANRPLFAAIERSDAPPIPANCGPRALLVGPEGGFVKTELESLRLRTFVNSVSLGPRILRADTACIAGLALLQGMDGR